MKKYVDIIFLYIHYISFILHPALQGCETPSG